MSGDTMIQPRPRPDRPLKGRPGACVLFLAAALTVALPASAGELGRDEPATIESDRAELDREQGVSRYFGNVEFVQGDLRITGERMDIQAPDGNLRRAETEGDPARIFHVTAEGERIRARAQRIVYEPDVPRVTLTGSAEVERGGDRFRAGRIAYAPDTGRVDAERDDGERVRITIQPETMNGDDEAENGDDNRDE